MDHNYIDFKVLDVLKQCNIFEYPIDCFDILTKYGYKIITYSGLRQKNNELWRLCSSLSEDAFSDRNYKIVAYNELNPSGRINFSLMHELGHIILEHKGEGTSLEREANYFASKILLPSMVLHYSNCQNERHASKTFKITPEAAKYAFIDYRRWYQTAAFRMSLYDKQVYDHFYREKANRFVWNVQRCEFCGKAIYNNPLRTICDKCLDARVRLVDDPYFPTVVPDLIYNEIRYN